MQRIRFWAAQILRRWGTRLVAKAVGLETVKAREAYVKQHRQYIRLDYEIPLTEQIGTAEGAFTANKTLIARQMFDELQSRGCVKLRTYGNLQGRVGISVRLHILTVDHD